MQIMDNSTHYGSVSRFLHWSIAALVTWQLLGMVAKRLLGRESLLTSTIAGNHTEVGALLFLLVWLRFGWMLLNRRRRPAYPAGPLGLAARAAHGAMYALLLFVPTVAVLRAIGNTRAFAPFGIELSPARPEGAEITALTDLAFLHGEAAWLLALLIAGHIAMALFHGMVKRDGTLEKMTRRPT
ncbi:cytochrome b/b6 domain-containing protein [Paracoccus sp. S1E-3]|uniref:cytochrome b n=1 Tax=Paracoccus sp. S1E-3 TaxID=2756130 RepID=UPI0015EFB422|nr:cytochrome b/b6 domain-containing protein [Paracoccus sp. S1E-3]MBA4490335.1 cytochrome b [Paracoccus sp. S1E-3]